MMDGGRLCYLHMQRVKAPAYFFMVMLACVRIAALALAVRFACPLKTRHSLSQPRAGARAGQEKL